MTSVMSGARPKGGGFSLAQHSKKDDDVLTGSPLDKKTLPMENKAIERKVPALHVGWAQKHTFVKYIAPPVDENGVYPPGAQEMWLDVLEYLEQDLMFLLRLPHHRFWSQIVYDPGVHTCLESYLINARRNFDEDTPYGSMEPLEESVHNLVMLVFIRMATYKESKDCHITPSVFGEMIYENFVFDICKILDICVLYGHTNAKLVSKMIGNIFANQPKYYCDLTDTIPTITLAFDNIEEKLGVAESALPVALSSSRRILNVEDIHDITMFLNDTLTSLERFLSCHPPACKYFHEANFEIRLSACYERIVPVMIDFLNERSDDSLLKVWIEKLMTKIEVARVAIIKIFRLLIQHKCFDQLQIDTVSTSLVTESVEKFLQVMSTCIGDKTFVADYCSVFPLSDDLDLFKKHHGDIASLDFITDAVSTVMVEMGISSCTKESTPEASSTEDKSSSDTSGMNGYIETRTSVPSDVELASLVSSVQDLFPDLGGGFIQECLQYFSYSTEDLIHALLENNLPPSLVTLDRSAPLTKMTTPEVKAEPSETEDKSTTAQSVMDRANVYDDDEFDVFSGKNVDLTKVHKGKRSNRFLKETANGDDKDMLKEIARKYEERGGTSIYEDEFRLDEDAHRGWEYDDEYDDTYDDNDPGAIDVMLETVKRRPGIIGAGRLNNRIDFGSASSPSEEETSDQEEKTQEDQNSQRGGARSKYMGNKRGVQRVFNASSSKFSKPKQSTPTPEREEVQEKYKDNFQFCENPEDVRRRAEQRRIDQNAHRFRGYRGRENHVQQNGASEVHHSSRPKASSGSNRSSGKSWRQGGQGGDDENRGYHGGKYKEDTNHGKAQSQQHRHKMTHKNEHKRQGAQAKFNRNN